MALESPFEFGTQVKGAQFTNREKETAYLSRNFLYGINTTLIAPRRWGKSSLVSKAAEEAKKQSKSLIFCFVDLYNIRTEQGFYQRMAEEVLTQTSSKLGDMKRVMGKFLGHLTPKLSMSIDPNSDISVGFDWDEVKRSPDEILDLAEKIAIEKKIKIVICVDEFQNLTMYGDGLALQKKLRSHWQKHHNVSYCLYGSRRHLMTEFFSHSSMPFYKFGEIYFLQRIKNEEWVKFLQRRFRQSGKKLNKPEAQYLAGLVKDHSYYVQQLAQQSWFRTESYCTKEIIKEALDGLVEQLSLVFQQIADDLTVNQLNYLRAIIDGEKKLSSKKVIKKYDLGSSANVTRLKDALITKEAIHKDENEVEILDPAFEYWLKSTYFRK